jgi:hypothetical protein
MSAELTGRGIFMSGGRMKDICLYHYEPGDCWCEIPGLGIAVRHSNGATVLVGPGTPGHKFEADGLGPLTWHAACA